MAWGMSELEAFRRFAAVYPDECVLLVDTIDVVGSGIPNSIAVFEELRAAGHEPVGIRIDSGDLAYLTIQAARLLDAAGFENVGIVLSSDLDELVIWQILSQLESEAPRYDLDAEALIRRITFGVGTRLISSHGASALGGVYKLVSIEDAQGESAPAIKLSESVEKMAVPGEKNVTRIYDSRGFATADVVSLTGEDLMQGDSLDLFHPHRDVHRTVMHTEISGVEPLMEPALANGTRFDGGIDLEAMRERCQLDLDRLHPGVRRLVNPHIYHVSLSKATKELQVSLARRFARP